MVSPPSSDPRRPAKRSDNETAQTFTLGREDDYIQHEEVAPQQEGETREGGWMQRLNPFGSVEINNIDDASYTSFPSREESDSDPPTRARSRMHLDIARSGTASSSLLRDELTPTTVVSLTGKAEDEVVQDCSFFYKEMESFSPRRTRRSVRAVRPCTHQPLFEYRDAVDVFMVPPVLTRYRTRYQQLNQVITGIPDTDTSHDLELTEDETSYDQYVPATPMRPSTNAEQSELLYQHPSGRLYVKMPCDKVRLIMDPDLEVGVLSVLQQRQASDNEGTLENRPSLDYTMCVSDDLYKRVIEEISRSQFMPCGIFFCGHQEHDRPSIGVAIVMVVLVLLFMCLAIYLTDSGTT
jgi:hypothetical protein